jgi:hypothetical protein
MEAPKGASDIAGFKMLLGQKNDRMEQILAEHVAAIKNTGFADARLCAMAHTKFEEGFLILQKALRINADPREYGKVPNVEAIPKEFTPPTLDDRRFGADADDAG